MDAALALKICEEAPFEMAEALLVSTVTRLTSKKAMEKTHSDVEEEIAENMREMARLLMQGHLDARGDGSVGKAVRGADRVERPHKRETGKTIRSIFGEVIEKRLGYSSPDVETLFPKDATLNLPNDSYSHGIHKRIAKEAARGSFDEAIASVSEATGVEVPKRQALKIVKTAACDFLDFYKNRTTEVNASELEPLPIVVITTDGKGVVMRKEGLREATKKKALKAVHKLDKRLSKGEKKNAKRMAQVAATYCIDRFIRKPEDIVREFNRVEESEEKIRCPKPIGKRVWASLEMSQKEVIRDLFCESLKRDPGKKKSWVALVDGQEMQLESIEAEAKKHDVPVTVILDIRDRYEITPATGAALGYHLGRHCEEARRADAAIQFLIKSVLDCHARKRRGLAMTAPLLLQSCRTYFVHIPYPCHGVSVESINGFLWRGCFGAGMVGQSTSFEYFAWQGRRCCC